MPPSPRVLSESWLIFIVGLVQFINILDFMMVMPLGPDFAVALGIPIHDIGWIGGSYTLAAALSGIMASLFLDNFDRKKALQVALLGLICSTALCAFAWNFHSLLAARFLAGMFGGPLSSVALAMVADSVPASRRGAAMGKVMGAFSAASVLGVPFGLELSSRLSWHAPFIAVSLIGLVVLWFASTKLVSMRGHIRNFTTADHVHRLQRTVRNPIALASFAFMGLAMASAFMIIPNISAHLQFNIGYPREHLGILYFCGGIVSFFGMRLAGKWIDRTSALTVMLAATALVIAVLLAGFVFYQPLYVPVTVLFMALMLAFPTRNVCGQTLSSKVPPPDERAGYTSLQSSVIHLGSATGAFISSLLLVESPGQHLLHVEQLAYVSIGLSLMVPVLVAYVERRIRNRPEQAPVVPVDLG